MNASHEDCATLPLVPCVWNLYICSHTLVQFQELRAQQWSVPSRDYGPLWRNRLWQLHFLGGRFWEEVRRLECRQLFRSWMHLWKEGCRAGHREEECDQMQQRPWPLLRKLGVWHGPTAVSWSVKHGAFAQWPAKLGEYVDLQRRLYLQTPRLLFQRRSLSFSCKLTKSLWNLPWTYL